MKYPPGCWNLQLTGSLNDASSCPICKINKWAIQDGKCAVPLFNDKDGKRLVVSQPSQHGRRASDGYGLIGQTPKDHNSNSSFK